MTSSSHVVYNYIAPFDAIVTATESVIKCNVDKQIAKLNVQVNRIFINVAIYQSLRRNVQNLWVFISTA